MQIQKVFKAGNSNVVSIPKSISQELGIGFGQEVFVDTTPNGEAIIIKKASKTSSKKAADKEFEKWLKVFMKENGEILDELAVR